MVGLSARRRSVGLQPDALNDLIRFAFEQGFWILLHEMPGPPDKTRDPKNDDVRERSYYYDDAHGYEDFDPTAPDDEDDESTSGGSAFDIDADGAPLAGVEPQESESASGDVPDEDRDPDMDRLEGRGLAYDEADAKR